MASVTIRLPSMLRPLVGADDAGVAADRADWRRDRSRGAVTVEAMTLTEALDVLVQAHPALRVHLLDEHGDLRQHVSCFHNDTSVRWVDSTDIPVADGDEITILQAVSGG